MKFILHTNLLLVTLFLSQCTPKETTAIEAIQGQKITLSFNGPATSEKNEDNPFLHYRMEVTFINGEQVLKVPGFYAADGNAAESSAMEGSVWQVRFRPDTPGTWNYEVSFRKGENIAITENPEDGEPVAFDGETGVIQVSASAEADNVFTTRGRLQYVGERYLRFSKGEYFLKGGADSPENLLGYVDFDGTYKGSSPEQREGEAANKETLHTYKPHANDWKEGDPQWHEGKGKNLIGAMNYLASKGMNSVYFLTMNIEGDGKDVWPYTDYEERERFDCSKLDQWEVVFDHMDQLGLMQHIVLQETENEKLLDDGDTKFHRKLYYREMIARFAHHPAVTWNMGEENGPAEFSPNGQTTAQQKAMVKYFKEHDPYQNYVVIHTHSSPQLRHEMYEKLLGDPHLDGPSIQINKMTDAHEETVYWTTASEEAGKPWVVNIDEIGHHSRGVDPDDREDNNQDTVRAEVLWGNLMAGGGGAEWYFGYLNHNNDLGCEDWRSRDRMWDYTRIGIDFFQEHLPFYEMESRDDLVSGEDEAWCLAKEGEVYAVYFPYGGTASLDLRGVEGEFEVQWFNPRTGGEFIEGDVTEVKGGEAVSLGNPPGEGDWLVLVSGL